MFSRGRGKPGGQIQDKPYGPGAPGYSSQVDEDDETGRAANLEMGRYHEGGTESTTVYGRYGMSAGHSAAREGAKKEARYEGGDLADRGSRRGSMSLYRSDINSDFMVNNDFTLKGDLEYDAEHVQLLQQTDTNGFIRRVYVIFTAQMVFATACVGACATRPALMQFQQEHSYLLWAALAGYLACDLCLLCVRRLSRQAPVNYIILLVATVCQGYMLSLTCNSYDPESVFMVFIVATATFTGMALHGLCARKEVAVRKSILAGVVAGGLTLGGVLAQWPGAVASIGYILPCCLGIFIALAFVVVDTQMMLKEKRWGIGAGDYIVATLMLYVDFVNIFVHTCRVIYKKKMKKKR